MKTAWSLRNGCSDETPNVVWEGDHKEKRNLGVAIAGNCENDGDYAKTYTQFAEYREWRWVGLLGGPRVWFMGLRASKVINIYCLRWVLCTGLVRVFFFCAA